MIMPDNTVRELHLRRQAIRPGGSDHHTPHLGIVITGNLSAAVKTKKFVVPGSPDLCTL